MSKIEREKRVVEMMIRLYCKKKEKNSELCTSCAELIEYAHKRLDMCKFGNGKPSCKRCPVHCYKPAMRERVRAVMRFSGPRMILHHPIAALQHLFT